MLSFSRLQMFCKNHKVPSCLQACFLYVFRMRAPFTPERKRNNVRKYAQGRTKKATNWSWLFCSIRSILARECYRTSPSKMDRGTKLARSCCLEKKAHNFKTLVTDEKLPGSSERKKREGRNRRKKRLVESGRK